MQLRIYQFFLEVTVNLNVNGLNGSRQDLLVHDFDPRQKEVVP